MTPLIVLGLMLIIGAIGGYTAHRLPWLPSITGFMVVGFLAGPSGLGILSAQTMANAQILIDIALALILYQLGLTLDIKHLWQSPNLLFTAILESTVTFVVVGYVLHLFGMSAPLAALVASIAISSSPAVLLHVAHEVGAQGEVTQSTKTLVALNNLLSFIVFSAVLPVLHHGAGADLTTIVFDPTFRLLGSMALGAALGLVLHQLALQTHAATQYKLALVIGILMLALGLANGLKLSNLFVPLMVGIMVKSLEHDAVISDIALGPAFELFFIVLFVFAGAGLHLKELLAVAPAVMALVLARILAKIVGVVAISTWFKRPWRASISSGLLLTPMAGLAIGLVQTSNTLFPQHAGAITALVLGAVTVFESIGPPIAAFAFRYAKEAGAIPVLPESTHQAPQPAEHVAAPDKPFADPK